MLTSGRDRIVDYIHHPVAAANIIEDFGGNEETIAAAYLHDTIEDTAVTYEYIKDNFNERIADMVHAVTKPPKIKGLSRSQRFVDEVKRLLKVSDIQALAIKLADIIDNTSTVVNGDKAFSAVSLAGKILTVNLVFRDSAEFDSHFLGLLDEAKLVLFASVDELEGTHKDDNASAIKSLGDALLQDPDIKKPITPAQMEARNSNDIKRCSFCGNSILGFSENKTVYGKKWNFVDCPACGCRGPFGLTVQQGIDSWNSAERNFK